MGDRLRPYALVVLDECDEHDDERGWCAAKYVWRWPYKGATPSERARDLRKAVECLTECERAYTAHVAAQRAKVAAMVGEVD